MTDEGELKKRVRQRTWNFKVDDNVVFNIIDDAKKEFPLINNAQTLEELRTEVFLWKKKWFGVDEEKEVKTE